jgi:hypothetical protein
MPDHPQVGVVEVERVTGRAIDECRRNRGRTITSADERCLSARVALVNQLGHENRRQRLTGSRKGYTQPVEQALLCDDERLAGQPSRHGPAGSDEGCRGACLHSGSRPEHRVSRLGHPD